MNAEVKEGDLIKSVVTNESKKVNRRTLKIIKKSMYSESVSSSKDYLFGIAIYEGNKEIYRPTYPFVRSEDCLKNLEKFVDTYKNDLLNFYIGGHNYDFGRFVYGIGSGAKDRFREEWFDLGVVFY